MRSDAEFPTLCGTGTEDYFCGSYNFENKAEQRYEEFNTPCAGMPQVLRPDGMYQSQMRFGLYRWHIMDPVRFEKNLRVTIQALGWRSGRRYLPLQDDIASVAYWYQLTIFPGIDTRSCSAIFDPSFSLSPSNLCQRKPPKKQSNPRNMSTSSATPKPTETAP